MRKLLFLHIALIFPSYYVFGNRLDRLENIANNIHRLAEQCPSITKEQTDDILTQFSEETSDLTHFEINVILQSKKDKRFSFETAHELGVGYNLSSCEYIAYRLKIISDVSSTLIEMGKGDIYAKDTDQEDFGLALNIGEKKEKIKMENAKKEARAKKAALLRESRKQMRKL